MNRLAVAATVVVAIGAALALPRVFSTAQEAPPPQAVHLTAAVDVTPIQTELAALRAEVTALRQAVTDPKGLRAEVAQAAAATKALDERLTEIARLVKAQSDALKPVVTALDPTTQWEYRCLRSRSEQVVNRLGTEGWQLVTASMDWLYFKRPLAAEEKRPKE